MHAFLNIFIWTDTDKSFIGCNFTDQILLTPWCLFTYNNCSEYDIFLQTCGYFLAECFLPHFLSELNNNEQILVRRGVVIKIFTILKERKKYFEQLIESG